MPKKKGQKNKGGNVEKKQESLPPPKEEKTASVPIPSSSGDFVASDFVTKETSSSKKKQKKGKGAGEIQAKSSQTKSVGSHSSNSSDVQILEPTSSETKLTAKQKKKKEQKEPDKQEKEQKRTAGSRSAESDSSSVTKRESGASSKQDSSEFVIAASKKGKKKSRKTEQTSTSDAQEEFYTPREEKKEEEEERREPEICVKGASEEVDFPSLEFTTQQSRKKRKQKKGQTSLLPEETPSQQQVQKSVSTKSQGSVPKQPKGQTSLPTEETPIQQQQAQKSSSTKSQSHVPKQSKSESTVKQKVTQEYSAPPQPEEFPITESKSARKQTQKKRSEQSGQKASQKGLVEEFQQLQVSAADDIKKGQPVTALQKPPPTDAVRSEGYELTIPHRKTRSGTKGRTILIETNHLALNFRKLDRAVHYDVTITPSTPKKLFRKVMEEFRQTYYKDRYPAFDGTKNLYSSSDLPFGQQITRDVTIYEDERPRPYKVAIKFANYVDLTPLKKFMTANPDGIHHMLTPQEVIQCLDIVLRSAPALTCLPVGRSYFTPPKDQILSLGGGMEMYYGFYQSAVVGWKPFLNIDVAHKAFPTHQNVIDLILELCELRREDLQRPLQRYEHDNVDRFIRTLKIRYVIPDKPGSKREFRVNGLEKSAIEATFSPEKGPEITVQKYFLKDKNIVLKYPHMPCLWVGNKDRTPHILLPAEFCTIIEGQVINRKMSEKLTSAMIKQAATSTKVRKDKIMESVHRAQFNKDPCVREFGITVDEEFTKIHARVLEPPALTYSGRSVIKPAQGAWRPDKFLSGATLTQWTIIILDRGLRAESIEEMIKLICTQAANLGMSVSQPQRPFVTLQPRYKKELQELVDLFTKRKTLQLLLVVVPNAGLLYSYVKQAAELAVGCLTQCIRNRTVCKINASTVINLLQKINAKLEGTNHVLNDRVDWMRRPYMIMGADVTHPSPDAKDKPSVAAVTASYDAGAFKYNICWRLQPPKVEIIEDLEEITREQLLYFYRNTKYKPERIIFFRDGVSEGQFSYVLNTEIQAIRRACICIQPDGTYKPKITFLVVQKRHHTRFFPLNPHDASKDKNLNVPVGTCVDTEITHPTALDFCLVSHASIQGVARPTKYRVLWDDADMSEDELEQLSFYFCHMFSRCTRSVSYPAPTYYAHLAAARIMAYCETGKLNMNDLAQEQKRLCIKECIIKKRPMFFV